MSYTKTIHVVSSGSYSDYSVICACPTIEHAEMVAEALRNDTDGWHRDAQVEELPLVDYEPRKVTVHHRMADVWDNGTTDKEKVSVRREWPFDSYLDNPIATVAWHWWRAPMHHGRGGRLEVWGTSEKSVAKVFGEKRAQALADPAFRSQGDARGVGRRRARAVSAG